MVKHTSVNSSNDQVQEKVLMRSAALDSAATAVNIKCNKPTAANHRLPKIIFGDNKFKTI